MMDVMDMVGDRSGSTMPLSDSQGTIDPGWGSGMGQIAPGVIQDIGGNGMRNLALFRPSWDGMQTGHGTLIMVAVVVAGLIAFHVTTRSFQA